jgi:hypothetical protein
MAKKRNKSSNTYKFETLDINAVRDIVKKIDDFHKKTWL